MAKAINLEAFMDSQNPEEYEVKKFRMKYDRSDASYRPSEYSRGNLPIFYGSNGIGLDNQGTSYDSLKKDKIYQVRSSYKQALKYSFN